MNALQGKKVVVAGGSSGIGFAIAKAAAEADAKVVISGRSARKLDEALVKIEQNILIYPIDLTQENSVNDFFKREGTIDYLVISGCSVTSGAFYELSLADGSTAYDKSLPNRYRDRYRWRQFIGLSDTADI